MVVNTFLPLLFQSLNRAYKRSDAARLNISLRYLDRFNPSIGLTSVPTSNCSTCKCIGFCFNPSIGLTSVPTAIWTWSSTDNGKFQSLNRAYKRSDQADQLGVAFDVGEFQSLNRAYKRSDSFLSLA